MKKRTILSLVMLGVVSAAQAQDWQPETTAPRDGMVVWIVTPKYPGPPEMVHFVQGNAISADGVFSWSSGDILGGWLSCRGLLVTDSSILWTPLPTQTKDLKCDGEPVS